MRSWTWGPSAGAPILALLPGVGLGKVTQPLCVSVPHLGTGIIIEITWDSHHDYGIIPGSLMPAHGRLAKLGYYYYCIVIVVVITPVTV